MLGKVGLVTEAEEPGLDRILGGDFMPLSRESVQDFSFVTLKAEKACLFQVMVEVR